MAKEIARGMTASVLLIISGNILIIAHSSCGLATALAIFYMFSGFRLALQNGKDAIIHIQVTENDEEAATDSINDRVKLARERHAYNRLQIEQLRRLHRIHALETKIANESHPYRDLAS
ncbi:MAG: hypothetical protein ACOYUZ_03310 [Patescibacteria group bacterium]